MIPTTSLIRATRSGLAAALAAAFLAAAGPAVAEEAPAQIRADLPDLTLADEAEGERPERRLPLVGLRLHPAPVGLAVEVDEGLHLGAAGDFDPESGDGVAMFALRFSL